MVSALQSEFLMQSEIKFSKNSNFRDHFTMSKIILVFLIIICFKNIGLGKQFLYLKNIKCPFNLVTVKQKSTEFVNLKLILPNRSHVNNHFYFDLDKDILCFGCIAQLTGAILGCVPQVSTGVGIPGKE